MKYWQYCQKERQMAKIKEITKSLSMKFATAQFANSDLFVCMKAELDDDDDVSVVSAELDTLLYKEFAESKAVLDGADISFFGLPQFKK